MLKEALMLFSEQASEGEDGDKRCTAAFSEQVSESGREVATVTFASAPFSSSLALRVRENGPSCTLAHFPCKRECMDVDVISGGLSSKEEFCKGLGTEGGRDLLHAQ